MEEAAGELEISYSPGLEAWLAEQGVSLAFAVPPAKLFLIGLRDDGRLSAFERTFNKCMGLAAAGADTIYLGTRSDPSNVAHTASPPSADVRSSFGGR